MRVMLTGIPSYLMRTVDRVCGVSVRHKPYFDDISTKKQVMAAVRQIANTGNYLIGEGAAHCLRQHDVTYMPFWHLVNSIGSEEIYEDLNRSFDIIVFASANLLRPSYSAHLEAQVFEKLRMPIVVMGIGIQRNVQCKDELPEGTQRFLDVLKEKEAFFLTRGHSSARFLRSYGMSFVRPTGCPSLYFSPTRVKRSLSRLADPDLAEGQRIAFGGYLGSVEDTIVDATALLKPESTATYVMQDEIVTYNLQIDAEDDDDVYDQSACQVVAPTTYKHADKWKRQCKLMLFFDTNRWRTWIAGQDFCLGRRFHGCVIGMQAGVPSLMIAVDDRMREMLEFIGFPYVEARIWNREANKKQFLRNFLSNINVQTVTDRYEVHEHDFRSTLKEIGIH